MDLYRNTGSQVISAALVTTDGTAVTSGTTTVYVTRDGGTQSTGSGSAAHEGNGQWTYVPTATETDATHVCFLFTNSTTGTIRVNKEYRTIDKRADDALQSAALTIGFGTVGSGSSTTSVVVSAINFAGSTSVGANALAGTRILFHGDTSTSGLRAVRGLITANTSGSTPTLTIHADTALPATPASGDKFSIV